MDAFIKKEAGSKIDLDDIYEEYKEWYKTESIPGKVLRKKGLREYLDKNLVKPTLDRANVFYEGCALKFSYSGKITNFGDEEDDL